MGRYFVQAVTELGTYNIMKLLLVIALSVVAIEAKPWYPYLLPHYPLVYAHPVVKVEPENICKNDAGEVVECALLNPPYYALAGLPHVPVAPAAAEERKKREAEAEPEAEADPETDPYQLYGGYYGYPYYGYGYGLGYYGYPWYGYHGVAKSAPCVNAWNQAVPCAVERKKREAEAEPEAVAEAEADPEADPYLLYGGYYGYPYGYGYGYGLGYGWGGYYGLGGYYGHYYGGCRNNAGAL